MLLLAECSEFAYGGCPRGDFAYWWEFVTFWKHEFVTAAGIARNDA